MVSMTGLLPPSAPVRARRGAPPTADAGPSGRAGLPAPPRPLPVAGLTAAAHGAALGLLAVSVLVLLGWATAADSGASAGEAVRTAVQVWLVGQGTSLAIPGGHFSLVPLGLSALPAVLLYLVSARATRAAGLDSPRAAVSLTAVVAGGYAVLSALLALLSRTSDVRPSPVSAFLAAGLLALAAGGAGAVRAAGCWAELRRRVPAPVALAAVGGAAGLAVLVAGGALVVATSLAAHHGRAVELMRGLDAGTLGGFLLFLVCVLYVPTAVVWSMSYVAGSGFALGAGTTVAPWGSELGAAPAFPLLAALPGGADANALTYSVLALPVGAGILAGLLTDRHDRGLTTSQLTGWRRTCTVGMGVGGVAGMAFMVLASAGSGAAGPGQLDVVGPPWWSGFLVAAEIGLVATATLLVCRPQSFRLLRPSPKE